MPAVEQCPHRGNVEIRDGIEFAQCRLLHDIISAQSAPIPQVPRGACEQCVNGVPPAVDRLNPVLASFVFSATSEIVDQGGVPGCDTDRAEELGDWARTFLEVDTSGYRPPRTQPRSFRDCCHLGPQVGVQQQPSPQGLVRTAVYDCRHADHARTTEAGCNGCRDWARRPGPRPAALNFRLPRPASWRGNGRPIRWAVGMTTAPRKTPTLATSLDALQRAGWHDVSLSVDGSTSLPPAMDFDSVTVRTPATGPWPNFFLTMLELVLTRSDSDAVMLVQDDALFYDGEPLREYLESVLWPSDPPGIVSLYCSAAYTRNAPGWTIADERWEWGALAFVFPMDLARQFVSDESVIHHRRTNRGLRFIDDVIGEWAERNAVPIWYPSPSLVQHTGETSTVWPGVPAGGYRRADWFAGDF